MNISQDNGIQIRLQGTPKPPKARIPCSRALWAFSSSLKSFPFILISADLRVGPFVRPLVHACSIYPSAHLSLFVLPRRPPAVCLSVPSTAFPSVPLPLSLSLSSSSFVGPLVKSGGAKIEVCLRWKSCFARYLNYSTLPKVSQCGKKVVPSGCLHFQFCHCFFL